MTKNLDVLYVTDDREAYAQGNYYLAYQRAFVRRTRATLVHPLEPMPDPARFDLVVLGQAAIEHYARMRGKRFVPSTIRSHVLWLRHASLRALRGAKTPVVLFTKNDYKHLALKNSFIDFVRPRLVITQHQSALQHLGNRHGKLIWLPFGVDAEMFYPADGEVPRDHVVGFRGNANSDWNGGERERFFGALGRLEARYRVSLHLSRHGEGFLVGKPYVDWLRSCQLLGNTASAAGTVGPRFLEAMACGTVPIAPRHPYEGFLRPDEHYVPVDSGADATFPNLEAAVERFLADRDYRETLQGHCRALVHAHTVDQHVLQVVREVGL